MKHIRSALILSIGLIAGYCLAVFGGLAPASPARDPIDERGFDAEYELARTLAFNNLITAVYWRQGMNEELGKYLDGDMLPNGLLFFEKNNRDDTSSEYFAWRLKKYYSDNALNIPANIEALLNKIPSERPKYAGRIAEAEPETPPPP
jgi:hypothetical protein